MAEVEIFYGQMCDLCHKAMDFFREKGVPFTAHEVVWSGGGWQDTPASRRMKDLCGDVDFVPQIVIRGRHIKGWRALEAMIESGKILELLRE